MDLEKYFQEIQTVSRKGAARQVRTDQRNGQAEVSFKTVLFGQQRISILAFCRYSDFYVCWNLLANTWGQFQTFALTNAGASQTQATGLGIILNIVSLITTVIFASVAGGKYRNKAFLSALLCNLQQ